MFWLNHHLTILIVASYVTGVSMLGSFLSQERWGEEGEDQREGENDGDVGDLHSVQVPCRYDFKAQEANFFSLDVGSAVQMSS